MIRTVWARAWARFEEIEAGPVMASVCFFLVGFFSALIWGDDYMVALLLAGAFVWLTWKQTVQSAATDEARDDADLAIRKTEAIEHHLAGLEPPGRGRHSRPERRSA